MNQSDINQVAIVSSNLSALKRLQNIIAATTNFSICWSAANAKDAINRYKQCYPDLLLIDLLLPDMSGIKLVQAIMMENPCPILIVQEAHFEQTNLIFDAMALGAKDVVDMPVTDEVNVDSGVKNLIRKMNILSVFSNKIISSKIPKPIAQKRVIRKTQTRLIAIGSSSGGPDSLATILSKLPEGYRNPIIVVQHVDSNFSKGLAEWLSRSSLLPVEVATPGCCLEEGKVLIAGAGRHLVLNKQANVEYSDEPFDSLYLPSIDVFFNSIVENWSSPVTAIILSGMGSDGATGLLKLKQNGAYTIVQDPGSCSVYGMPKSALDLGAAVAVLSVDSIAKELCNPSYSNHELLN